MREDRGESLETKGQRGRGPGGGLWAAEEGRAHRRGGRGGSAVLRVPAGPQNSVPCPTRVPVLVSVPEPVRGAQEEADRRLVGPGSLAEVHQELHGTREGSRRAGVAPMGRLAPAWRVPDSPADPQPAFPAPLVPGPRQASVGRRQRLTMRSSGKAPMLQRRPASPAASFSMAWAPPGPPSRGPDGQSRAVRAPAPAATSWGRRGAPRLAARPGCGRHVAGLLAGRRPLSPRPSPHPPALARSSCQVPPPRPGPAARPLPRKSR